MSELLTVVDNLNNKVKALIEKLNNVQGELTMVKEENLSLNSQLVDQTEIVENLNERIANLESEVERGRGEKSESNDVRMKIDEMVREIDECIALIKE